MSFRVLHFVLSLGALGFASEARAQRPEIAWRPVLAQSRLKPPRVTGSRLQFGTTTDSIVFPRTYWLEGAAVGGGLAATLGAVWALESCRIDGCRSEALTVLGAASVLGVFGFGVGALIGARFPKE